VSVLSCGRNGCTGIMCDFLIDGGPYICRECLDELREYRKGWPSTMMRTEVKEKVDEFMASWKGSTVKLEEDEIDKELDSLITDTRRRSDDDY